MTKKAVIFDLDNTIYSAPSIGDDLFAPLYKLIRESQDHQSEFNHIKHDMVRKPFHVVAATHRFGEMLTQQGLQMLQTITYDKPIAPFTDYAATKKLLQDKYLVTSGFHPLQHSKIKGLQIEKEFKEIHIVDITKSSKKEVFADIMNRHSYSASEILVVGDDLHSEIKAAADLGINAVLYDKENLFSEVTTLPRINDFEELIQYL